MAKAIMTGVSNVARKVKQPYIEVDLVARNCIGGFVGVGNVARAFFDNNPFRTTIVTPSNSDYITINNLSVVEEDGVIILSIELTSNYTYPNGYGMNFWLNVYGANGEDLGGKTIKFSWKTSNVDSSCDACAYVFRDSANNNLEAYQTLHSDSYVYVSKILPENTSYCRFGIWFSPQTGTRTLKFYIKDLTIGDEIVHLT